MKLIIVSGFDSTQMIKFASNKIDMNNNERVLIFPESGLHYSNIIKLFEKVFKNNFAKIAIVTHSDFVNIHIRRLVTENKINNEDIEMYFLESDENIIEIKVTKLGSLSTYPSGLLDGNTNELSKIFESRKNVK